MNSPRRPDGPPVRDGKPYSQIAHLAEDVTPFIAMAQGLRARGLSAPAIFAADRAAGLLVLEDLGNELVVAGEPPAPIEARYAVAVDVLGVAAPPAAAGDAAGRAGHRLCAAALRPGRAADRGGIAHRLVPAQAGDETSPTPGATSIWRCGATRCCRSLEAPATWVLRDYHSPNLLWLPEREGVARIGLLDFQDAVLGPPGLRSRLAAAGCARRRAGDDGDRAVVALYARAAATDPGFDAASFARAYATLAAQRASKILGIFARLDRRDGKPQYLRHLPRVWAYLQRALAHPALAPLNAWYRANVPSLKSL